MPRGVALSGVLMARIERMISRAVAVWLLCAVPAMAGQVVMNAATGQIIAGKDETAPRFPASITKLMTAYVALDAVAAGQVAWDAPLTVSAHAAAAPPVKLGLRAGQTISMKQAVHAILVRSSNDAARVIAEAVAGSEPAFAAKMTRIAGSLGMTQTTFRNASGLPDRGHISTAVDLAKMIVALDRKHGARLRPLFRKPLAWGGASLRPRNGTVASPTGSILGKTGFTCDAGFTAALLLHRGADRTAIVTLGNPRKAARSQAIAVLARGRVPSSGVIGSPPIIIPRDVCARGSRSAAQSRPGGWTISLGNFKTKTEARAALDQARKAGIKYQSHIVTREGREGYHALLSAPSRQKARDAERPLRKARLRTRIFPPEKVVQAEFEPD